MKQKRYKGKYSNKKRSFGWIKWLLMGLLVLSASAAGIHALDMAMARSTYDGLSEIVQAAATETAAPKESTLPESPTAAPTQPEETIAVTTVPPETEPQPLPQYLSLYEKNPDFFGWVKIDDTKIDYPVMYAPDDLEKYLHNDYEGNYFYGGTPYMDVRCSPESENYLIYGHNMLDGSMFRGLMKYEKKTYWESHPIIQFDTLYEERKYEIVAAFYDRVYYSHEDCFKFYNVIDLEDEAAFNEAISNFKAKAIYDTGVTPEYGDQLITLITCAYHTENGRFVVVAAKKAAA